MNKAKFKQTETCGERSREQGEGRSRTIGEIPEGWEEVELDSLGEIVTGKTPSTIALDNFGDKYPFVTPRDMKGQKHIYNTERYLSEKGKDEVTNCMVPGLTICVSCIGSDMGKVVITTEPSVTNQQLNSIVPKKDVNPDFVYYAVTNITDNLRDAAFHSTAVPILNKSSFSRFKISVPKDKNEAEKIAKILSDLDEKIELNHQMNKTLEAMGQALFKRWFVDDGRNSIIGRLGDILEVIESGSRPKGGIDPSLREGNPSIGAENIDGIGFYDYSKTKFITPEFYNAMNRGFIKDYDVLVYKDGAYIGRKSMFGKGFPFEKCCVNEHVFILRANSRANQFFLYYLLNQEELKQLNTSSAQPGLNQESMRSLRITIPNKVKVDRFGETVKPLIDGIFFNCNQARILSEIRDFLLPRLMSGRLRVV